MNRKTPLVLLALVAALGACSKVEPPAASSPDDKAASYQSGPVSVTGWGPQGSAPGVAANPLPSGNTGMYFTLSRSVDGAPVQVLFDGQPLKGVAVDGKTVTAELPVSQTASAGQHAVSLKLGSGETIDVGHFVVAQAPAAGASAAPTAASSSGAVVDSTAKPAADGTQPASK